MSLFLNQRYWVMSFGVCLCSVLLSSCEDNDNPHKGNTHMEYWSSVPVECQLTKQSYFMLADLHTVAWLKYKCVDREEIWVVLITGRNMPSHGLRGRPPITYSVFPFFSRYKGYGHTYPAAE